jgi:hypothetical protein
MVHESLGFEDLHQRDGRKCRPEVENCAWLKILYRCEDLDEGVVTGAQLVPHVEFLDRSGGRILDRSAVASRG